MNPFFVVWLAIYELVTIVFSAVGAPIVCLFAKWDKEPTTWTGGAEDNGPPTVRGDLPNWAWPWASFDERLPGGMYEPTVQKVYNKFGRYWCSVYWLNRNKMMGLAKALYGVPPSKATLRWYWRHIGNLYVGWGWKRYRATPYAHWVHGPFVDVPSFTVRWRRK